MSAAVQPQPHVRRRAWLHRRRATLAAHCSARRTMTYGLESPERQHVDGICHRRKRLAALLVVEPGQPAMAVRIMIERDPDATLARGDGCAATRAEWPLRTAAGARHGIEGQRFPRERLALPSRCHLAAAEPIQFSWRASAGRGKVGKLSPCRLLATRELLPSTGHAGTG
jgi:hypothetical protein